MDNAAIAELNNQYRNKPMPTDVLSFPLGEDGKYDIDENNGCMMLGDIVISMERAMEQANLYGHPLQREVAFLTVHSMLHLLGYDHLEKNLLSEEDDGPDNEGFFFLAKAIKEMSQAARLEQDFETKIRDRVQKETVKAVESSAREAGLSAETVEAIKSRILGVKDA